VTDLGDKHVVNVLAKTMHLTSHSVPSDSFVSDGSIATSSTSCTIQPYHWNSISSELHSTPDSNSLVFKHNSGQF